MTPNTRSVLLTGGAGYIGAHVARMLNQAGYTPITLDDLSRGHRYAVKWGDLVEGDIGDAPLVHELCQRFRPCALLHFAALSDVGESCRKPDLYHQVNVEKATRLFHAVRAEGIKAIVFSSTAAVYGQPTDAQPLTEDSPCAPINPYGVSKRAAEDRLAHATRQDEGSFILRYFNAAGAAPAGEGIGEHHHPETHLIPNALRAILGQSPALQLFGSDWPTPDGTAIRDYIHVDDLATAHVRALDYLLTGKTGTTILNLGTGSGTSVREILHTIEHVTGQRVPHTHAPRRQGDPAYLVAAARRAYGVLGWRPTHDLESIVRSAWAWHTSREMFAGV